jgi:alkylhydroperoxidase family enzyme
VRAVLADYRTAPITEAEKALLAYVDKVNRDSTRIGREDVEAVKQAGWSDEAIYDAVTVCALFNFYNRWIDATGVHDMPAVAYERTGKRLAEHGYVTFGTPPQK